MAKKQEILEKNIELLEENRKLLKTVKSGADIAYLIKDMSRTMKTSLELVKKEISVLGEMSDLFETSMGLADSMKDMAEILIDEYRYGYEEEFSSSDVFNDYEEEE